MVKKQNMRKRSRRQRGGATPYYSFGAAVAPEAPYASKVEVHDSPNVMRPGFLASANAGTGGLPGFTGGGKKRSGKRSGKGFLARLARYANAYRKNATRYAKKAYRTGSKTLRRMMKQRGGRYTVDPAGTPTGPNVFAPVSRIACEGGYVNPLNPGPHTGSSQPPVAQAGGRRCWTRRNRQRGGAGSGLLGSVDAAAYYAPTAGYSNEPSKWVSSVGTPSLLQLPYDARAMNPACLKTGGGKRRGNRKNRA